MKSVILLFMISTSVLSCKGGLELVNQTRPGGYAMGEEIDLKFSLSNVGDPPDSIEVNVLEKKTGYTYFTWARKIRCDHTCIYIGSWDGRKPDGRWPAGGRYLIYGFFGDNGKAFSDTVKIGLAD